VNPYPNPAPAEMARAFYAQPGARKATPHLEGAFAAGALMERRRLAGHLGACAGEWANVGQNPGVAIVLNNFASDLKGALRPGDPAGAVGDITLPRLVTGAIDSMLVEPPQSGRDGA
jgi:hypothetical protein